MKRPKKEVAPLIVDIATAAKMIGKSTRHLFSLTNETKELPSVKRNGKTIGYRPVDLEKWVNDQVVTSQ